MEIPVGKTYIAHAVMAAVTLTICALQLALKPGWIDFGSLQAAGMLLAIFGAIPAGLFAAYSAITVIVALVRRQRVPRDMILLPAGLIVSLAWASVVADFGTPLWNVVAYLPLAGYVIMVVTLIVRHRSAGRGPATP